MNISLQERLAILELLATVNHAFDDGDAEAFAGCFTSNAVLESSRGQYAGRQQLESYVKEARTRPPHMHLTTNTVITNDLAVPRHEVPVRSSYLYLEMLEGVGLKPVLVGTYFDRLACISGSWLITQRFSRALSPNSRPNK